jgi:hypothetical protein
MEAARKNFIYDRLTAIKIKIEAAEIPSPMQVNGKLADCSAAIDEVERYSIEISKEISVLSQAYNNSISAYEYRKEQLLEEEDIKILPTIKERESRADSRLKKERDEIRSYKNELTDLNNLLKQITMKMKNLGRVNMDVKVQLRLLEAQIELGGGPDSNAAMRSLADEFKKGMREEDVFEEASSETSVTHVEDSSVPLDVNSLLTSDVPAEMIDPIPTLPDPDQIDAEALPPEKYDVSQEAMAIAETQVDPVIDLDQAIDFTQTKQKGGPPAIECTQPQGIKVQTVKPVVKTQKEDHPEKRDFDLDSLLDSIQQHHS